MQKRMVGKFSRLFVLSWVFVLTLAVSAFAVQQGTVNTVLGPMPVEKMGVTLPHEHFVFGYPGWHADETIAPYNYEDILKNSLDVIALAKKVGVQTIIDATPNDVGGRNPKLYVELAKKTGMNIICSTGLYTEHDGSPVYFKTKQQGYKVDIVPWISEIFIKEINDGIGTSGVRPGVIKVGTSGGGPISQYETAVLKAAVVAQKATGIPIITHTSGPAGGIEQAELFLKEGADPKKVMIGHVSNSKDINYHRAILAKGVYIAFDRLGIEIITPTPVNVKNIAQLCKEGYANRIMLSQDSTNYWLGRRMTPEPILKALAEWKIDFIGTKVIPMLKAEGVTDEQIRTMMVENPKNLFLGK